MTEPRGGNTSRTRRWLVLMVFGGLILAYAFGVDTIAHPWAASWLGVFTGRPALVGQWYGELTTPTGGRQWVALNLSANLRRCPATVPDCARLLGVARLCEAHGEREYDGRGHVLDWRGTRFVLELMARDDRPVGLRVIRLQAARERADIHAVAQFESGSHTSGVATDRAGNVARPAGSADTLFPVKMILRKSSDRDFETACRRLSSQTPDAPSWRNS